MNADVIDSLEKLGVGRHNYPVLAFLPLAHVAWADGDVSPTQHSAVSSLVESCGLGRSGTHALDRWLSHRPSSMYLALGRTVLQSLWANSEQRGATDRDLITFCIAVARRTEELFDAFGLEIPGRPVLMDAASALEVDPTTAWLAFFQEHEETIVGRWSPIAEADDELTDPGISHIQNLPLKAVVECHGGGSDGSHLRYVSDDAPDVVCALSGGELSIGRARDNQVQIRNDRRVSRYHCRLTQRDGQTFAEDLGSANGLLVNGDYVVECELRGGEQLTVGETVFAFHADEK